MSRMSSERNAIEELKETLPLTFASHPIPTFDRNRIKTVFQVLAEDEIKDNRFQKIPTSIKALDDALNGGFCVGHIIEIYGKAGTGKTQFVTQLCVNVQKPKRLGGLEGHALFIDGEACFRPSRLLQMVEAVSQDWYGYDVDVDIFLKNVHLLSLRSLEMARVVIDSKLDDFLTQHAKVTSCVKLTFYRH